MTSSEQIAISVIVPVYNAEATLRKCLDSLSQQSLGTLEFLCVNDGSRDSSLEILQEYAGKDSRFRVLNKENGGVSTARNFGLEHARGEYIMFLDSDDWYEPDTCEQALALVSDTNADLGLFCMTMEYAQKSVHRSILSDTAMSFDAQACSELHRRCIGLMGPELKELLKFDYLSLVYLKIFRRDIIERENIRFYDIRKIGSFEDGFFNMQYLSHTHSAVYSPQALYHYNKVNQSSITTKYREQLPEQWKVLFSALRSHVELSDNPRLHKALDNRIAYAVLGLGLNVMSGEESFETKYKKLRAILHSDELHRSFSGEDLKHMPFPFAVFFIFSSCQWTMGVYLMLWLMAGVRNRNKGIKQ